MIIPYTTVNSSFNHRLYSEIIYETCNSLLVILESSDIYIII